MKLAHAIVSCRDDLGLSTQVTQGPLSKELLDKTYHEVRQKALVLTKRARFEKI